jgi:hypothetical protein
MYPHEIRTFTAMTWAFVCVSAKLLSLEPTHAHLSQGVRKSNLAKFRIFLKKNMSLLHAVDMDVTHMYAWGFEMNTMEKQTFPHVQKRCLRRNTYACARQHSIYIRKCTLAHDQKRCLRRNTYVYVWQHCIYITKPTLTHVHKRC